jgi:glycine cleavage system H lipoate-binding protein
MLNLLTCFSGLQDHLGDVVFVELPDVGSNVYQGNNFGAVESVKATSDVISPVSGEVVEVNEKLSEEPGLVRRDSTVSKTNWKISIPWVD